MWSLKEKENVHFNLLELLHLNSALETWNVHMQKPQVEMIKV